MTDINSYLSKLHESEQNVVRFVVHNHNARRAGKHQDFRFQIPKNRNWASFAVPKNVPLEPGNRVLAIRTHDHSSREALFTGEIPPGEYGGGNLEIFDQGLCRVEKYTSAHITLFCQGAKVQGRYHFISIGNVNNNKFKQQQYMLFKSKPNQDEITILSLSGKDKMLFQQLFDKISKFFDNDGGIS